MRKLIMTGLVVLLALAAAACDREVCYRDGKRDNTPPIPFANVGRDFNPTLGLTLPY